MNLIFALCLFFLAKEHQLCSPIPGFRYPLLQKETDYSAAIIHGRVKEIVGGDQINDSTVVLEVDSYIKGCGDSEVVVTGFQGASLCGSGIPDQGEELVVFVCPANFPSEEADDLQKWKLNTFSLFTGALFVKYDPTYPDQIRDLAWTSLDNFGSGCLLDECRVGPESVSNISQTATGELLIGLGL